jgi:hypothetical protein
MIGSRGPGNWALGDFLLMSLLSPSNFPGVLALALTCEWKFVVPGNLLRILE